MATEQGPLDSIDFALIGHVVMYSVLIVALLFFALMVRSIMQGARQRGQRRQVHEEKRLSEPEGEKQYSWRFK